MNTTGPHAPSACTQAAKPSTQPPAWRPRTISAVSAATARTRRVIGGARLTGGGAAGLRRRAGAGCPTCARGTRRSRRGSGGSPASRRTGSDRARTSSAGSGRRTAPSPRCSTRRAPDAPPRARPPCARHRVCARRPGPRVRAPAPRPPPCESACAPPGRRRPYHRAPVVAMPSSPYRARGTGATRARCAPACASRGGPRPPRRAVLPQHRARRALRQGAARGDRRDPRPPGGPRQLPARARLGPLLRRRPRASRVRHGVERPTDVAAGGAGLHRAPLRARQHEPRAGGRCHARCHPARARARLPARHDRCAAAPAPSPAARDRARPPPAHRPRAGLPRAAHRHPARAARGARAVAGGRDRGRRSRRAPLPGDPRAPRAGLRSRRRRRARARLGGRGPLRQRRAQRRAAAARDHRAHLPGGRRRLLGGGAPPRTQEGALPLRAPRRLAPRARARAREPGRLRPALARRDRAHDRAPRARPGRRGVAARARRADPHGGAARLMARSGSPRALLAGGRLAVAADAPVPLGPCGPIARVYDALEVPAAQLRHLGGTPLARLGLLAFRKGEAAPIPFQLDERRGRKLALPGGPEPTADDKPGVLDADDILVFMACDAGEQASPAALARALAEAGADAVWRELRIEDPVEHTRGFVYLVSAAHPPASERRYLAYVPEGDLVESARYRIGLVNSLPTYFVLAAGTSLGPNLIDGLRLRAEATLRADLAHWTLDEQHGHHELIAWKAGPVRVVRRSRHQVVLGLGIHLTAGIAHTYFYPQHVYGPGSLKLPFSPGILFRDISAYGGVDGRDLRGWRYFAPGTPPDGFAVDGHMDERERAFASSGEWFVLAHGSEALLFVTRMSENLRRGVTLSLVYTDDAAPPSPPA